MVNIFSNEFNLFCEERGIINECTTPYTPQQNGIAEKKNSTFSLWGETLLSACHILNRIPMKKNNISPYELWKGKKINIGYLKVWGCLVYCKSTDPKGTKLGTEL